MNFFSFLSSMVILAYILSGCNGNSNQHGSLSGDSLMEGEKPVYYDNGKLHYIVESKNGKTNGRVREYIPDGKLYMDAMYKDDHRHGKCTHYFKNGKPFSVSYYKNGAKDSIETKYNEQGQVLALVPYKNDKVQPGLKEFARDGSLLPNNCNLIIKEINHLARNGKFYLIVSLSEPRKNVKFYAAPQSDPDSREVLKISENAGILELPKAIKGLIKKNLILEAEYKTSMGNTMRLQQLYNLVVFK